MAKDVETRPDQTRPHGTAIKDRAPGSGEPRWPMALAVLAAMLLTVLLPKGTTPWSSLARAQHRGAAARGTGPWGSGEDLTTHEDPQGTLDRPRGAARGRRALGDRCACQRTHPRRQHHELSRRTTRRGSLCLALEQHRVLAALLGARRRWRRGALVAPPPPPGYRLPAGSQDGYRA